MKIRISNICLKKHRLCIYSRIIKYMSNNKNVIAESTGVG